MERGISDSGDTIERAPPERAPGVTGITPAKDDEDEDDDDEVREPRRGDANAMHAPPATAAAAAVIESAFAGAKWSSWRSDALGEENSREASELVRMTKEMRLIPG